MIRGIEYVFYDHPYWDKEKKQNRHRRTYVGKLDRNGDFVPNAKWHALNGSASGTNVDLPRKLATRQYCGATYLLDEVCREIGLTDDLRTCLPRNWQAILSLAYYLVLESDSPMYRFGRWAHDHRHPYGSEITSQRISELVLQIPEQAKMEFFRLRAARIEDGEYLAYDSTSVSSYSEAIKAVRYGKNKDGDDLPQINIGILIGERSCLPVYYRILPGNIADVSTLPKLILDVDFIDISRLRLVIDRGFCSRANMDRLLETDYSFVVGGTATSGYVKRHIDTTLAAAKDFRHFDELHGVFGYTYKEKWQCTSQGAKPENAGKHEKTIYVHVYYNGVRAEDEKLKFAKKVRTVAELVAGGKKLSASQESTRDKYLVVGDSVDFNDEAIRTHMDRMGYFALVSNNTITAAEALELYRRKDIVEKAFDNCKDRLELRRTAVNSDAALAGTLFVQFVALIIISGISKRMRSADLFRTHTMQSLLDALDVIERYDYHGIAPHFGEITNKQALLYQSMGVSSPNTL